MTNLSKRQLAERVANSERLDTIQPLNFQEAGWKNELLMFVKPEIFMVGSLDYTERALDLVFQKLDEFKAQVDGIVAVGGKALEEKRIMDRHYGFINEMSRSASTLIGDEDWNKILEALNLAPKGQYKLLGGHEFLAAYPGETYATLDTLWFTKKSVKIRSGFYVQVYEKDGAAVILVNGFHPAQLAHFTEPTHRVLLLLLHSNSAWSALRNEMVGVTFPEKAVPGSIRGSLHAEPGKYGFESVTIANNGVHLSAGPYEGLAEINNFFGNLLGLDPQKEQPLLVRRALESGITLEKVMGSVKNPPVTANGKSTDLFGATEDKDTVEALALLK